MAGDTTLTVVGNLTADPELRFTSNGHAVANFTVASTPRRFNKTNNTWEDGDAEHVAESLTRGTRVVVVGRLRQRSYETREGEKRTVVELEVDEVGPSLRYVTVTVNKAQRNGATSDRMGASDDPWATAPAAAGGGDDEPPF